MNKFFDWVDKWFLWIIAIIILLGFLDCMWSTYARNNIPPGNWKFTQGKIVDLSLLVYIYDFRGRVGAAGVGLRNSNDLQ